MEQSNYDTQEQTSSKLNEVKNIIFGDDIQDYDRQISLIRENLNNNRSEMLEKLEEVKNHLLGAIKQTEENLLERIDAVKNATNHELERQDKAHVSRQSFNSSLLKISDSIMNE